MNHLLLTGEHVEAWWPGLVDCVKDAVDSDGPAPEFILEKLKANELFGIIVTEGEQALGFVTARFRQEQTELVLDVITIGGRDMKSWWAPTLKVLEEGARRGGAKYVMFQTKRDADRFCEKILGFEKVATTFRKRV